MRFSCRLLYLQFEIHTDYAYWKDQLFSNHSHLQSKSGLNHCSIKRPCDCKKKRPSVSFCRRCSFLCDVIMPEKNFQKGGTRRQFYGWKLEANQGKMMPKLCGNSLVLAANLDCCQCCHSSVGRQKIPISLYW